MNNKIVAVTNPDDVLLDGNRILIAGLTEEQMSVVSSTLSEVEEFERIILYIWNESDDINWLLDKKLKSDLIIFNAGMFDKILVGYLSAQPNSCYFGTLQSISKVNDSEIKDLSQLITLMEKTVI